MNWCLMMGLSIKVNAKGSSDTGMGSKYGPMVLNMKVTGRTTLPMGEVDSITLMVMFMMVLSLFSL